MKTFSDFFKLEKTQPELDFVNIPIDTDIPLFIDPFAISLQKNIWSEHCNALIKIFFEKILSFIQEKKDFEAKKLMIHLGENNETRLGFSKKAPRGNGVGQTQSLQLFEAFKNSKAVKEGGISHIEECELMIEGISFDKMSDIITNIIKRELLEYTYNQCELFNIPVRQAAVSPYFCGEKERWISSYADLPIVHEKPIILVPKIIVRRQPAYDHQHFYQHFVLNYLKAEHIEAHSSLVTVLKNGDKVVYKKDLKNVHPCTKIFLYDFCKKHPEILKEYRKLIIEREKGLDRTLNIEESEGHIAEALNSSLQKIDAGTTTATDYHNLIIGMLEFVLFPFLSNPKKEKEIHDGRKRIDIVMTNSGDWDVLERLRKLHNLWCPYVMIECKNYSTEIANPELDQLSGRFSDKRGRIGFLCCRNFEDKKKFLKRCSDTYTDNRGLIIPLDDEFFKKSLLLIKENKREMISELIQELINEICV